MGVVLSAHGGQLAIAEKANQGKREEELLDEAEVVVRLAVQADASPEYPYGRAPQRAACKEEHAQQQSDSLSKVKCHPHRFLSA